MRRDFLNDLQFEQHIRTTSFTPASGVSYFPSVRRQIARFHSLARIFDLPRGMRIALHLILRASCLQSQLR